MLDKDMNYFKLIQEIKKIKASLSIMVGDDTIFINKAKLLYKRISTIYTDTEEENKFLDSKSNFMKFLERDEIMAFKGKEVTEAKDDIHKKLSANILDQFTQLKSINNTAT